MKATAGLRLSHSLIQMRPQENTIEMPELPDVYILAKSMNEGLSKKKIIDVIVNQPKCLNLTPRKFKNGVQGRSFERTYQRGKWITSDLNEKWSIAFNLGMGGEILLHDKGKEPVHEYHRVVFTLDNGEWIGIHHWWFGHVHLVPKGDFSSHPQISKLGVEPLSKAFTVDLLGKMLHKKRGRIKSYLLDQSFIAGIGNVYVQDILWYAKLHPTRQADSLEEFEIENLHGAIQRVLKDGIRYGGGPGEQDLFGKKGRYMKHRPIGYRTGEPCPECSATIEEIRIGSTTSYICPKCQV
ncbi:MAG: Fpg/Nei family DNA glycosylase [Candidatus Thorarchaeota archaeon]